MSEPSAPNLSVSDVRTDDGLSTALAAVNAARSWEGPAGSMVLEEVRRRAVRVAAHVASKTGVRCDRTLVHDVVAAAWAVLSTQTQQVGAAERRWAYVMSAAGKTVLSEAWGQRHLTSATKARGEARAWMPRHVDPVGVAGTDLDRVLQQPLATPAASQVGDPGPAGMVGEFVDVLVAAGADRATATAAVDRMSELLPNWPNRWETTARRDPVLADLGLSPDQASALVALLAGSRRSGRSDGLLAAIRDAHDTGRPLEVSFEQRRRLRTFTAGHRSTTDPPAVHVRELHGTQPALFDRPVITTDLAS